MIISNPLTVTLSDADLKKGIVKVTKTVERFSGDDEVALENLSRQHFTVKNKSQLFNRATTIIYSGKGGKKVLKHFTVHE